MLLPRSAVGAWRQLESLQRQGPNLARGVVVCQPLSGAAVWKLLTEDCCLLRWCGILEYSLPLRPMCDTFHLSDSHANRQCSNDLKLPLSSSCSESFYFLFYFLSKMNIAWLVRHLEIYNRFSECFTPQEREAWGQESQHPGKMRIFACNSHRVLY